MMGDGKARWPWHCWRSDRRPAPTARPPSSSGGRRPARRPARRRSAKGRRQEEPPALDPLVQAAPTPAGSSPAVGEREIAVLPAAGESELRESLRALAKAPERDARLLFLCKADGILPEAVVKHSVATEGRHLAQCVTPSEWRGAAEAAPDLTLSLTLGVAPRRVPKALLALQEVARSEAEAFRFVASLPRQKRTRSKDALRQALDSAARARLNEPWEPALAVIERLEGGLDPAALGGLDALHAAACRGQIDRHYLRGSLRDADAVYVGYENWAGSPGLAPKRRRVSAFATVQKRRAGELVEHHGPPLQGVPAHTAGRAGAPGRARALRHRAGSPRHPGRRRGVYGGAGGGGARDAAGQRLLGPTGTQLLRRIQRDAVLEGADLVTLGAIQAVPVAQVYFRAGALRRRGEQPRHRGGARPRRRTRGHGPG